MKKWLILWVVGFTFLFGFLRIDGGWQELRNNEDKGIFDADTVYDSCAAATNETLKTAVYYRGGTKGLTGNTVLYFEVDSIGADSVSLDVELWEGMNTACDDRKTQLYTRDDSCVDVDTAIEATLYPMPYFQVWFINTDDDNTKGADDFFIDNVWWFDQLR